MKKENISKVQQVIVTLTIIAMFVLSVAAQNEPVCSKYYGVGMRTCDASSAVPGGYMGAANRGGTLTLAGGRTVDILATPIDTGSVLGSAGDGGGGLGSGADGGGTLGNGNAVNNGQLGSGNAVGNGQLGTGSVVSSGQTLGSGGAVDGGFWNWIMSFF